MADLTSSAQNTTRQAAQATFVPAMRELVRTYQAFAAYSEAHVRQFNLTSSQFDVVATLGNTNGMSMSDIGEKTLITKGTLTGVIDRLIKKDLVRRRNPPGDRRSVVVSLTDKGQQVFEQVFPAHIAYLKTQFENLEPSELELLRILLSRLRQNF
ncbi:MAG: MarR family transcriptional regulator [Cyanobacteria bacterium P01_H01_bin.119]